jgi:hypothetical protein
METVRFHIGKLRWDGDDVADDEAEHKNWSALSVQMLERTYGENEPEYSADLIKETPRSHHLQKRYRLK